MMYCMEGVSPCSGNDALEDTPSNTYSAIRVINNNTDVSALSLHHSAVSAYYLCPQILYAEFRPRDALPVASNSNFTEMYDLMKDPFEMHNIVNETDIQTVDHYKQMLYEVITCKGKQCP